MRNKSFFFLQIISITFLAFTLTSCQFAGKFVNNGELRITNINIYKDTPAWELAKAVKKQDVKKIQRIAKENKSLLDYQEPKYGATLLLWSVGMEKYESAEALLKYGADPDIEATKKSGETPLFIAASSSWIDTKAKKDAKFVKLLLKYGADPNKNFVGGDNTVIEPGTSPLMNSIPTSIEKTKALVEAGADINYKTKTGDTAAMKALRAGGSTSMFGRHVFAHYLIVEKKAKVTEPSYSRFVYENDDPNEKFYPVDLLRYWISDLDSDTHKLKMEIVKEFERQGVNYWDTPITKSQLENIKKLYPDTWEEYIKKY